MQPGKACALLAFVSLANAARQKASNEMEVTPIQKVLQLMEEMKQQGITAKKEEEVKFTAFSQWCTDQQRVKKDEIAAGEEQMELLNGKILKAKASIRALSDRIEELEEDVNVWEKDTKAINAVRKKEKDDYDATLVDYTESLSAVDEATAVLKKQAYDRSQTELMQAFLQVQKRTNVPQNAKNALTAFLQTTQPDVEAMPDNQLFIKAPEAYAYEFQSGGVVDILEKLKDEFATKKRELMFDEQKSVHAYNQVMQQITDNTENANHEISKKKTVRAQTQKAQAEAEENLATTTKDRDEDQNYLDQTVALCKSKSSDFESRQELRSEEIEAIQKAIDIISSNAVKGTGEKHLPSFLQVRRSPVLAQMSANGRNHVQERIAAFLADRAHLTGSRLLSQLSQRVAADPFTKVKRLIKDLISQLMQEATAETEHKGWCDTELTTNKMTRDKKTEEAATLTAQTEDLTAQIAQLAQDIADLAAAIKELEKAMAEATEERTQAKEANELTIKEAKEAQTAVQQALAVLREFYAKAAEATALAQQSPAEDAPETFNKPYKGMGSEGGGVMDFLEVILTDFERLESETASEEDAQQDQFEKFMFESKKDKALKENESKHKEDTKTNKESELHSAQEELASTQEQLAAAEKYYDKLKPTCVDSGITYEERVKRREAEIQSLQEALEILAGEDIP